MAVALSSVTNGATVNIPLQDGSTLPFVKIGYNHYNKKEATLALKKAMGVNIFNSGDNYNLGYLDLLCGHFKGLLDDSISGALIPVSIAIENNPGTTEILNFPTNIIRSIFIPSMWEFGLDPTTNNIYEELMDYQRLGNSFSVNANWFDNTHIICRNNYIIRYTPTTGQQYMYYKGGVLFQNGSKSVYRYLSSSSTKNDNNSISNVGFNPFICLDGNIQVSSSSGGNITQSTAIKSYRKINGVWYRTV